MAINPISSIGIHNLQGLTGANPTTPSSSVDQIGKSFQQMLASLNESQESADSLVQKLSLGENVDLHQVMIGIEENDVNFRVSMAIRDKLIDAYQQVMRMQI